jgi:hypothetical protein
MDFKDSSLNMKFLLGSPIEFNGLCTLHPKSVGDIENFGIEKYNQYLSVLCISSKDIYELFEMNDDFENVEPFDFILSNCIHEKEFLQNIITALSFFMEEDVCFYQDDGSGYFYIGDINDGRFLHRGNFNFFIDILRKQNCTSEGSRDNFKKPQNEAEKEFYKNLMKARSKYNRNDNSGEIANIISSVCAKHPSINLFNVSSLTMYQLIDQYKRLNAIDEYFISIKSLLAGASSEDVQVVHWAKGLK